MRKYMRKHVQKLAWEAFKVGRLDTTVGIMPQPYRYAVGF